MKRGRGFAYLADDGKPVSPLVRERVRAIAIPPAWSDVWICADPLGHLQATGTDAAGRKQYLYHERWREQRDRQKFRRMIDFAQALPRLRRRVGSDLAAPDPTRERTLACAVRLLDIGLFRIGGEEYAEQGGGLGLATICKEHVELRNGSIVFDYPAKSGVRRVHEIVDPLSAEVVSQLKHRRGGGPELLAYRDGRRWTGLHSEDINDYVKRQIGDAFSAKDFRTWNATVLAALALAADGRDASTKTARRRAINSATRDVAEMLGNTPAVARRAYIDPRIFDRYASGWTIRSALVRLNGFDEINERKRRRVERAVLDLLAEPSEPQARRF